MVLHGAWWWCIVLHPLPIPFPHMLWLELQSLDDGGLATCFWLTLALIWNLKSEIWIANTNTDINLENEKLPSSLLSATNNSWGRSRIFELIFKKKEQENWITRADFGSGAWEIVGNRKSTVRVAIMYKTQIKCTESENVFPRCWLQFSIC